MILGTCHSCSFCGQASPRWCARTPSRTQRKSSIFDRTAWHSCSLIATYNPVCSIHYPLPLHTMTQKKFFSNIIELPYIISAHICSCIEKRDRATYIILVWRGDTFFGLLCIYFSSSLYFFLFSRYESACGRQHTGSACGRRVRTTRHARLTGESILWQRARHQHSIAVQLHSAEPVTRVTCVTA